MSPTHYRIAALILAAFATSCGYESAGLYPASGYSPADAYSRGQSDGSFDRTQRVNYNPHINEGSRTLPSAWRTQYLWGYNDGFRNPGGFSSSK